MYYNWGFITASSCGFRAASPCGMMVELADTQDLKSCAHLERAGSSPAHAT